MFWPLYWSCSSVTLSPVPRPERTDRRGYLNVQYAHFLSVGVKWIVIVLAFAMALEDLKIARGIVELAFGILFGGMVLTLSLAVGLNSKDLIEKSLERNVTKASREPVEDSLRHL